MMRSRIRNPPAPETFPRFTSVPDAGRDDAVRAAHGFLGGVASFVISRRYRRER